MKKCLIAALLGCSLLLSGCGLLEGSYHSVTPHREQTGGIRTENMTVSSYEELYPPWKPWWRRQRRTASSTR